ncbi:glycoside hydrolase family 30 protein [Gayadomonas joobiniege]|uniref:glycoside hydrolase family 30 protein n=1 Tax=Gayadomonas joobiniege TaxID=1234606 RepID=UPI00037A336D|nr:glycoside hydrolase [Gayadomonas joobiniege]
MIKAILCILVLLTSCLAQAVSDTPNIIFLDNTKKFQKIRAFGASDAWIIDPLVKKWIKNGRQNKLQQLSQLLFSPDQGIGLTAWRFNLGAGSLEQGEASQIRLDPLGKPYRRAGLLQKLPYGPIDPNAQQGQLYLLKQAAHYKVPDLIAFVNSPPVWATKNGLAFPDRDTQSSNLNPEMQSAYVDFLINAIQYLRQELSVPINFISPVNEPTWEWKNGNQEGSPFNNQELKSLYLELYQKLKHLNLSSQVQIEGGEVVEYAAALSDQTFQQFNGNSDVYQGGMNKNGKGLYKNYIQDFLGDPAMRTVLGNKLSLHGYFSDAASERLGPLRDQVWQHAQTVSPGAELWMSEMCILGGPADIRKFRGRKFDGQNMQNALHIARIMHRDLTRLNVSAWHWWLAVTAYDYKDGLLKVNAELDADSLITSKTFWALGQYSRFIRPGYYRIETTGADDLNGLMASAYQSPTGHKQVVVIINAAPESKQLKLMGITQPQHKNVSVYLTNQTFNLAKQTDSINFNQFMVPANSITTVTIE